MLIFLPGENFPNVQELMDAVLAFESNTRSSNVCQGISRLPVPLDAPPGNVSYRTQAASKIKSYEKYKKVYWSGYLIHISPIRERAISTILRHSILVSKV